MSENVYMGMDLEQLQKTVNDLASASPINQTELDTARQALAQKLAGNTDQKTDEIEPVQRTQFEFVGKFDFDAYAKTGSTILNSIVQTFLNAKNGIIESLQSEIVGLQEQKLNLEYQNKNLQTDLQLMGESNLAITTEKNHFKDEYDDYRSRFDAATKALNEKDAEIERLKHHNDDLQQKLANAPAPTVSRIDVTAQSFDLDALIAQANEFQRQEEARKEAERLAARPKITNLRWKDDIKQKEYEAELVGDYPIGKDGQTIEFGRLDINMYQVMSEDDAARFRSEQAKQSATTAETSSEETTVPDTALVEIPKVEMVDDFRPTEAETLLSLHQPSDIGGVVPEAPVTWEAIEKRLAEFKQEVIRDIKVVA